MDKFPEIGNNKKKKKKKKKRPVPGQALVWVVVKPLYRPH